MKPRIDKPEKGNRYYISTKDGGVNPARGNPLRQNPNLTALPNCVAIYGWFNEIGERGQLFLKKAWYPYTVIAQAKREGLLITKEPHEGGIMVWTGGKTGEGHVAGCAVKYDDDTVLTAESEYYGYDWRNYKRERGKGNWSDGCYWMDNSYHYEGCINNPFMETDMTKAETEKLIKEMVPEIVTALVPAIIEQMEENKTKLPEDDWAKNAIDMSIAKGIMVGYPDGWHPQSNIRREEVAVVNEASLAYIKEYVKSFIEEYVKNFVMECLNKS